MSAFCYICVCRKTNIHREALNIPFNIKGTPIDGFSVSVPG